MIGAPSQEDSSLDVLTGFLLLVSSILGQPSGWYRLPHSGCAVSYLCCCPTRQWFLEPSSEIHWKCTLINSQVSLKTVKLAVRLSHHALGFSLLHAPSLCFRHANRFLRLLVIIAPPMLPVPESSRRTPFFLPGSAHALSSLRDTS